MRAIFVALLFSIALIPASTISAESGEWSVVEENYMWVMITEILVSPNDESHNGTDWNGDGEIGIESDQYMTIQNNGSLIIDLTNWSIDDGIDSGSPPCKISNITISPGDSVTFFRAVTDIEFDYFDGDYATLIDSDGVTQSQFSYPGYDSDWDRAYRPGPN